MTEPNTEAQEIIDRLNELLAAERAGVAAAAVMLEGLPKGFVRNGLEKIRLDESWSCAGLHRAVTAVGGEPTQATGDFDAKIAALDGLPERLELMSRGQAWVVKRIDVLLVAELEENTERFLREMRDAHQHNIDWCDQMAVALAPQGA
ncbi:MAG: DUF6306 domain-containing protein [Dehalococcoidia bacterium]|nr:DUF6306 domain-containing protein [Dehalococcoidia bacterium]